MSHREACEQDWIAAVPKLAEAITKSPGRTIVNIDLSSTLAHFMTAATRGGAFVVGEKYLVVYDKYPLWYAPGDWILEEKIILSIYPEAKATLFDVFAFLVSQKAEHEADHLVIGDFLHPNQEKYGRVLEKLGMTKINSVYAC